MMKESWNPVLNKIIEIKNVYVNEFGVHNLYMQKENKTCFENWVDKLQNSEYSKIVKLLQFNQKGYLLLIRYANYTDIYNEIDDVTLDDFWNLYDGFYQECRSVVINLETEELVLTPFRKFRNINECEETSLYNIEQRIKNAKCIEFSNKLDGSMQCGRFYNGKIIMSASQSLDENNSWRLKDGYKMLLSNDDYIQLISNHPYFTFIFEYISLKDAHVVKYTKEQEGLYLIGIRNVFTGEEMNYNFVINLANLYNVKTTELFDKQLSQVLSELDNKTSDEAEGFVLNIDGFKVKIKYSDYVNVHKILSKMSSPNLIIHHIADNTFDDFISKIPNEHKVRIMNIADKVFKYIKDTNKLVYSYVNNAPSKDKKEFMLYVKNNVPKKYQSYVREIYLGREVNYIKSHSNTTCPHYKNMNEIGLNFNIGDE